MNGNASESLLHHLKCLKLLWGIFYCSWNRLKSTPRSLYDLKKQTGLYKSSDDFCFSFFNVWNLRWGVGVRPSDLIHNTSTDFSLKLDQILRISDAFEFLKRAEFSFFLLYWKTIYSCMSKSAKTALSTRGRQNLHRTKSSSQEL